MGYSCNEQKGWHVFYDGSAVCVCCFQKNPELQCCKHRPQAEVKVAQGNNEAGKTVK